MRVVFFGTPEFAVPSLRELLRRGVEVAAVVTQPDRPQGRSRSAVVAPPVKRAALEAGLPVLQPERPVGDLFATSLRHLRADLAVVVAYGHILRPDILAIPRHGMINVHASLLPRWRGAAPIAWAILHGDPETGISIMRMEAGLDSGPVLLRVRTPIGPEETAGRLTERLAQLGAAALGEALERAAGTDPGEPQDHAAATYAPKIDRGMARIALEEPAGAGARRIRAFDPVPGAWATLRGTPVKLFGAHVVPGTGAPGQVIGANRVLVVAFGRDAIEVDEVQPAGKPRMSAEEWVRGRGVAVGDRFE
ncbi:MAG TPA: methionyl-tRNA formyltransferase [Gemmatimonadales bacterium]|nr:methionyl-tRNA formyltransferase [Gemmatimonadales bacterium]